MIMRETVSPFARAASLVDRLVEAAAVVVMLSLLGSIVAGVVTRMLNQPLVWTDELAQYLLVWLGFLGWIIGVRRQSHIRIVTFIDRLPRPARIAFEVLAQAGIITLAAIMIWQAGPLIRRNIDVEAVTLPFPTAMLYILLPLIGLVLVAQALFEIHRALTQGDRPHDTPGATGI
jgi:TRAP-type C4-dicarboxylate transport system permease small subunit